MLFWLFAVTVLYVVQLWLPAGHRVVEIGISRFFGSRDDLPPLAGRAARLERAAENMKESYPIFVALAVASLAIGVDEQGFATFGASLFFLARLVYVGLYWQAVPYVRSLAWMTAAAALVVMAVALLV